MEKNKVFGIGFQKTATSTLAAALYILGYNVTGYFGPHDPDIEKNVYNIAFKLADRFDAAQDTPWPVIYKELDERYPNSKFILTMRDADKWVNSVVKHFKKRKVKSHQWIYGVPYAKGYEEAYIQRYETHNREVLEYFKERPNDLLVMDITKGDGWELLCPFLGNDIPCVPFPVQNTATAKSRQIFSRGTRYLMNKYAPNFLTKDKTMKEGVSTAFVRDMLHYHCEMFNTLLNNLDSIDDQQFVQEFPFFPNTIYSLLMNQINLEDDWLTKLQVENPSAAITSAQTIDDVRNRTHTNQALLRNYIANISDEMCNAQIPGEKAVVWEAFMDIMNHGTENRVQINNLLRQFDVDLQEKSFVEFFNP